MLSGKSDPKYEGGSEVTVIPWYQVTGLSPAFIVKPYLLCPSAPDIKINIVSEQRRDLHTKPCSQSKSLQNWLLPSPWLFQCPGGVSNG